MSMTDLVHIVLQYAQNVRTVKGIGLGLSSHYVILCNVRMADSWIKRRNVVNGNSGIRSDKLIEHQYIEDMLGVLGSKRVE